MLRYDHFEMILREKTENEVNGALLCFVFYNAYVSYRRVTTIYAILFFTKDRQLPEMSSKLIMSICEMVDICWSTVNKD